MKALIELFRVPSAKTLAQRQIEESERYRFIKKLAEARTGSTDAHFRIVVRKEYGGGLFGKPSKVTNYRTVNGAVDRLMRDTKRSR